MYVRRGYRKFAYAVTLSSNLDFGTCSMYVTCAQTGRTIREAFTLFSTAVFWQVTYLRAFWKFQFDPFAACKRDSNHVFAGVEQMAFVKRAARISGLHVGATKSNGRFSKHCNSLSDWSLAAAPPSRVFRSRNPPQRPRSATRSFTFHGRAEKSPSKVVLSNAERRHTVGQRLDPSEPTALSQRHGRKMNERVSRTQYEN